MIEPAKYNLKARKGSDFMQIFQFPYLLTDKAFYAHIKTARKEKIAELETVVDGNNLLLKLDKATLSTLQTGTHNYDILQVDDASTFVIAGSFEILEGVTQI